MTVGREDFDAVDRAQACIIAAAIWNSCSDIASDYELWCRDEPILHPGGPNLSDMGAALSNDQQHIVVDRAIALRGSNWLVAESKKLTEEIEKLRSSSMPEASKAQGHRADHHCVTTFETFVSDIESPALRALARHWSDARGAKPMPSWDDLSSAALAPHFKLLWGYQFDRQRGDFTGRLAGQHVRDGLAPKFCGAKLEDIHPPQVLMDVRAFLGKVVATPGVGRCSGRLFTIGDHTVTGERLALPLATNGISADGILGASDYVYPSVSGPVALIHENIEWCAIAGQDGQAAVT